MAETLEKNLDDMEEVTEGTTQSKTAVNKDAKPGEPIDTSKGGAAKVISVDTDSMEGCLLYTSPSPRDVSLSRMPSSA